MPAFSYLKTETTPPKPAGGFQPPSSLFRFGEIWQFRLFRSVSLCFACALFAMQIKHLREPQILFRFVSFPAQAKPNTLFRTEAVEHSVSTGYFLRLSGFSPHQGDTMYTEQELAAWRKVSAIKSGRKHYGWVTLQLRLHPDDAPQVDALARELCQARESEIAHFVEAKQPKPRFSPLDASILAALSKGEPVPAATLRAIVAKRTDNPDSVRVMFNRAMRRLVSAGKVVDVGYGHWAITQHPPGGQRKR